MGCFLLKRLHVATALVAGRSKVEPTSFRNGSWGEDRDARVRKRSGSHLTIAWEPSRVRPGTRVGWNFERLMFSACLKLESGQSRGKGREGKERPTLRFEQAEAAMGRDEPCMPAFSRQPCRRSLPQLTVVKWY